MPGWIGWLAGGMDGSWTGWTLVFRLLGCLLGCLAAWLVCRHVGCAGAASGQPLFDG
jgi:hypothetical protein